MKIIFRGTTLFMFFLILVSSSLKAQHFNAGLMIGGDVSQVDGDTYSGYTKFGYLGGAYVGLQVSPHSSFQMELEYIQKGSRNDTNATGITSYLLRIHYIEVPILYQYIFKSRFYFEAGPAIDIYIGSLEMKDGLQVNGVPIRSVCFSGIFGFGAYVTKHLRLNLRTNYSLNSLRSKNDIGYYRRMFFERGQYNNVLSLSVLWDFKAKDF
jgi:hypothetical protein